MAPLEDCTVWVVLPPDSAEGVAGTLSSIDGFLGHPVAKILYAYNPSRESEVVVNSVFTTAGHFHVPPVHCRIVSFIFIYAEIYDLNELLSKAAPGGHSSLHRSVNEQLLTGCHFLNVPSCYVESDDVLRLQMSIIVTMGNSSKEFEENTQDLLDHLSIIYVATDKSETSGTLEWTPLETVSHSGLTARMSYVHRRSVLGTTRFAHSKRSRESEPFASFLPRLIPQPGVMLNFSATALRSSVVKYFVVKNPSSLPVSLQLLPISLYPRPEAAVRLLHKWFGTDTQMINFTTGEFQLTKACPYQGVHAEESGFGVLHLHLQPLEMKRVGVVFTPADYGKVTSLILIRNNLTVIDMVGVEGFGARELLKVGGRLPGAGGSLRFKVPESTLMDCRRQLKDSKQILSITKNFKVENIGPLPITVTSLKINGYNCQGYGFEVLDCHQFSLDPSTSRDISIVFTPDFTSSWVIRELTLVTAADLEFRFTLNVTLPHHLLPLCADVVPGPSWEESFWRLTVFFVGQNQAVMDLVAFFLSLSLLGVILIAFQQAQYILMEFMKTRQRQNASSSSQQSSGPVDVIGPHSHKALVERVTERNPGHRQPKSPLDPDPTGLPGVLIMKENPPHAQNHQALQSCRRPSEQSELKLVCSELERSELSGDLDVRSWCIQENPGETCKTDAGLGRSLPAAQGEAEGYYQDSRKKCGEKSCSDSSSDCGSSSGSVRASRGSWGSWSSTSSSDGDKKLTAGPQHFQPAEMRVTSPGSRMLPVPAFLLDLRVLRKTKGNSLLIPTPFSGSPPNPVDWLCCDALRQCLQGTSDFLVCKSDTLSSVFKSTSCGPKTFCSGCLYPPGDLWPSQPVCVTSGFSCALESGMPAGVQGPAPLPNSSFIDWSATCEGQFPGVYCPLELNDYNAFPEENMNCPSGFPCPAAVQTDFADHSSQSAWNSPPSVPSTWGHAGLISSPPYLTSTRSLSPMSGLFGSIWAPQNDVYDNCCPVSPTTEHSTHLDNQAVMCKEYYPGFNPFRAYMNLDIWTTTANRNANFPLSRDSGYCGNV
ncbi:hypothetical protein CB1_001022007 [Camelus ferus]|nr:hypothetical protein CB1_001022007 [Camelus ferus]